MNVKRLRLFAGPNGSGKSTIINELKQTNLRFGIYLNADDLETILRRDRAIPLADYGLGDIEDGVFNTYINDHSIAKGLTRS